MYVVFLVLHEVLYVRCAIYLLSVLHRKQFEYLSNFNPNSPGSILQDSAVVFQTGESISQARVNQQTLSCDTDHRNACRIMLTTGMPDITIAKFSV